MALILGDSSAWIDHIRKRPTPAAERLRSVLGSDDLVTTDAVMMEVLAGARSERHRLLLDRALRTHRNIPTEPTDFEDAAAIFRVCRQRGVTPRNLVDCLIAAVAIRIDATVLHSDRDFDLIAEHVGLTVDRGG
jgi:predicted nucleic acid-binding protein